MIKYLRISTYCILGSPSSYMTLQLLPSEFSYIWGKLYCLYYQCNLWWKGWGKGWFDEVSSCWQPWRPFFTKLRPLRQKSAVKTCRKKTFVFCSLKVLSREINPAEIRFVFRKANMDGDFNLLKNWSDSFVIILWWLLLSDDRDFLYSMGVDNSYLQRFYINK